MVATDIERHRRNLEQTRAAVARAVDEIKGRRPGIGRDNQLRHAKAMVASIDKVLGTPDGKRSFPDGADRSASIGKQRTFSMSEVPFPSRRTSEAEQRDRTFIAILDTILQENETITARAVARRLEGVDHASSITRDRWRNARLSEWQARQVELRRMIERTDKSSKSNLAAALERKDARIRELEERVALLR